MSGLEIERKFLVKKGDAYKRAAFSSSHIQQGYIPAEGATVRVRVRDDKAYLTIKGKSLLIEHDVMTPRPYNRMYQLVGTEGYAAKYPVEQLALTKEQLNAIGIDYPLKNEHAPLPKDLVLVMAEVELGSETEDFVKPDFIGPEVTGDPHFYNSHMLAHPFSTWKELVPEEYR